MKNDITKLTAYEIGILLEKKNRPHKFVRIIFENYNLAEKDTKKLFLKYLKKRHFLRPNIMGKTEE